MLFGQGLASFSAVDVLAANNTASRHGGVLAVSDPAYGSRLSLLSFSASRLLGNMAYDGGEARVGCCP